MSWDDKNFMARGFRVRHKYVRRPHCHARCVLCGTKRRKTTSGWEYRTFGTQRWTATNPPCVKK